MLRAANSLRFTPDEVDEFRSLGLDFEGVAAWAGTLADERPDLLDKIVSEMAKVKGVKPPARLTTVVSGAPSAGSPRQS